MADLKLFEYQHKQVRTVVIEGQIWFVAKDVCGILEIINHKDAVWRFNDKMKRTVGVTDPLGQEKPTLVISEAGVYKLAFRSNKPEAERFTDWVAGEVIPEIRKTGRYVRQHQGVLPLAAHADTEVQKDMSKAVNAHNYQLGGKEATMEYNIKNAVAHAGRTPAQLIRDGKAAGLKSKDRSSGKAVLRATQPAKACCMSLADNLVEQGFEAEKVFEVTKTAEPVFDGILELGATPAELKK
ncbi:MAG: Bro-N domain-containing protein [Acidobacteriota bacterium]|nr:Bro-N domain-containing protein [Acidobacteriota bacterium]